MCRTAVLLGVAVSACAEIARAEQPPRPAQVVVEWTRAPGAEHCISPDELLIETRARVSTDAVLTLDRKDADFSIIGRIEPRAEGFRTELVLRDAVGRPLGKRTFELSARSCRALDDSLIVALVLLVETPRVRNAVHGRGSDELVELSPLPRWQSPEGARLAPLPLPSAPQGRPWTLELGLGGSAALGFMPSPTVGPTLFGLVRPPRFVPIVVRATAYPFGVEQATVPGEGIVVRGFLGGAEVCPLGLARSDVEVHICGGAHLAVLQAQPIGPRSNVGGLVFGVLPLRVEGRVRLGAVSAYAAATARFSPTSPSFKYFAPGGEERTSFAVPWLTSELAVGLVWHTLP